MTLPPSIINIVNNFKVYGLGDPNLLELRANFIYQQIQIFNKEHTLDLSSPLINFLTIIYAYRSISRQIYSYKAFCSFVDSFTKDYPQIEIMDDATDCGYLQQGQQSSKFCSTSYDVDCILSSLFKGNYGFNISLDLVSQIIQKISPNIEQTVIITQFEYIIRNSQIVNKYGVELTSIILVYLKNKEMAGLIEDMRLGAQDIQEMTKQLNSCHKEISAVLARMI